MKRFTMNIEDSLHDELKTIAFFSKQTMSDIVLEKIKEVIKEYQESKLKVTKPINNNN